MAAVSQRFQSCLGGILVAALLAAFSFSIAVSEAYGQSVTRAVKKTPQRPPPTIVRQPGPAVASISRRSLASSDDIQGNINALLQEAVQKRRIDDIEKLALTQRYATIPGRGDFALLECLKAQACDLRKFPDLAADVGNNQLHLHHAARCIECNRANVYKRSGNTVESMMHSYYERGGWRRIEGEIGGRGIDGLYFKLGRSGRIEDVLVTEAKYGTSQLQETSAGTQLSKQWILEKLTPLKTQAQRAGERDKADHYAQIYQMVEGDVYRAQVWRMNVDHDRIFIWRLRLGAASNWKTVALEPIHGKAPWNPGNVHLLDMIEPRSNFDQLLLNDYQAFLSRSGIAQ